jgi:adenylate kinase family enzyme
VTDALARLAAASRVLVVGPSGSGKTQLALRLGDLLGLPVVHLDAERWQPGWVALPDREWREAVAGLVGAPRRIMDGTYESTLDLRVPAADAVIVLERHRVACLAGVLRRRLLDRGRVRPDAPPGQPLDRAFLRYIWRYPDATRPILQAELHEHGEGKTVIVLRGWREVRRFRGDVARATRAAGRPGTVAVRAGE